MKPYYDHKGITIYHGDCLEIMPQLDPVDLVLTDPPYGNNTAYASFDDSAENVHRLIIGVMPLVLEKAERVVLTPGVANIWRYPEPTWILAWVTPAGTGSGPWGFCCWQPIMVYGKDPYLQLGRGRRPDYIEHTERAQDLGHPCSKPLGLWKKVMNRVQVKAGTILDPFMGSGTTLRAAKDLGHNATGIEIEEKYCEIAARRLAQEMLPFGSNQALNRTAKISRLLA